MADSGVKIEIHLIQNFAPSSLNRDDTGQPKSAYFGGFRRARISSQCVKRAVREWWRQNNAVSSSMLGDRTKRLQQLIREEIARDEDFMKKAINEEEMAEKIRNFTEHFYSQSEKDNQERTKVLVFISREEVKVCAKLVKELWEKLVINGDEKNKNHKKKSLKLSKNDKEAALSALKSVKNSADIALFGRMLAEHPDRNTDGACQLAHAISTHRVDMEIDFYTAIDDLSPEEETGAGMMGIIGYNSACYYRYAVIDRDQLARNLAGKTERRNGKWAQGLDEEDYKEADEIIRAFLEAMVFAMPSGRQNSFAARNLPSFGMFIRRQGGVPISLANAFAKPVWPKGEGDDLVGLSVKAMIEHWEDIRKKYDDHGVMVVSCFQVGLDEIPEGVKEYEKESVEKAIEAVVYGE